jgi:hypothetical protein
VLFFICHLKLFLMNHSLISANLKNPAPSTANKTI